MDLNFTVSLTDIGFGLDVSGNSESERQEILDFLVSVDESMADAEFTRNLVYRLAEDYSHDVEVRGWEPVALPEERATTFGQLYEALSYMDEDKLIALVANAMAIRRERESVAAANAVPCEVCEHPMGVHNMVCLPGLTGCCHACDEEAKGKPVTHKAFPPDTDGAGVAHPGPVSECTEKECLIELNHGGTVTDCVGGPCECKEGTHE